MPFLGTVFLFLYIGFCWVLNLELAFSSPLLSDVWKLHGSCFLPLGLYVSVIYIKALQTLRVSTFQDVADFHECLHFRFLSGEQFLLLKKQKPWSCFMHWSLGSDQLTSTISLFGAGEMAQWLKVHTWPLRPRFSSRHLHICAQSSVTPGPGHLASVCTHTTRMHAHTLHK